MAVDAAGMPVRIFITEGTRNDCTEAERLIDGIIADYLIADKGYNSKAIKSKALSQGMTPVIPPKKDHKIQEPYDKELYKHRHLVENAFLALKRWRGIATRYAKNAASFMAAIQIRCIAIWMGIY